MILFFNILWNFCPTDLQLLDLIRPSVSIINQKYHIKIHTTKYTTFFTTLIARNSKRISQLDSRSICETITHKKKNGFR